MINLHVYITWSSNYLFSHIYGIHFELSTVLTLLRSNSSIQFRSQLTTDVTVDPTMSKEYGPPPKRPWTAVGSYCARRPENSVLRTGHHWSLTSPYKNLIKNRSWKINMDTHIPKMMEKVDSFKQNGHSLVFLLDFLVSTSWKKNPAGTVTSFFHSWPGLIPQNGCHFFAMKRSRFIAPK